MPPLSFCIPSTFPPIPGAADPSTPTPRPKHTVSDDEMPCKKTNDAEIGIPLLDAGEAALAPLTPTFKKRSLSLGGAALESQKSSKRHRPNAEATSLMDTPGTSPDGEDLDNTLVEPMSQGNATSPELRLVAKDSY